VNIVLLHSALGLTRDVLNWADVLRDDDHVVVTPDMFGGDVYADMDAAMARVDGDGGSGAYLEPALAGAASIVGPRVYAGFSLGASVAQILALTQPDAAGMVLMHSAISPSWIEVDHWPDGLRGQVHYAEGDPWVEQEELSDLMALAGDALQQFTYDGDGHLFAFESWHEYDADAAERMFERVTDFLADLDNGE